MPRYNPNNERIKRQYFVYLKEAKRYSEATVDAVAKALARFESANNYRDFKSFHHLQAVNFKRRLAEQRNQTDGAPLSKATLYAALAHLTRFFQWLAGQPGYKSRFQYSDADYFNLSEKETRIATARRERPCPTLQQIKHVIRTMPTGTELERRDRAILAFTLLTGARDAAVASMKLKHVDLEARSVYQDARDVRTKFSKSFTTFFFPVGDEIVSIVEEWVNYLRNDKLWGNDDPLFPATHISHDADRRFAASGLECAHWSSARPIRDAFRRACHGAGLRYFNPHSLRSTLVQLGQSLCQTPEQFKAWSQNLGHEGVLTTFLSYGRVESQRQGQIILNLEGPQKRERAPASARRPEDGEALEDTLPNDARSPVKA